MTQNSRSNHLLLQNTAQLGGVLLYTPRVDFLRGTQKYMNILAISGSLRKGSFNSGLLRELAKRAPQGTTVEIADIGVLPLYNQDREAEFPSEVAALKAKIKAADGIIIATPEYNRSVPGVLKNVIDWTSRPYGDSAWDGKPVYIVGATGGQIGTAVAQYALKTSMIYLNTRVLGQPEFYLGGAGDKFDADGNIIDASTIEHVEKALAAFIAFISER